MQNFGHYSSPSCKPITKNLVDGFNKWVVLIRCLILILQQLLLKDQTYSLLNMLTPSIDSQGKPIFQKNQATD